MVLYVGLVVHEGPRFLRQYEQLHTGMSEAKVRSLFSGFEQEVRSVHGCRWLVIRAGNRLLDYPYPRKPLSTVDTFAYANLVLRLDDNNTVTAYCWVGEDQQAYISGQQVSIAAFDHYAETACGKTTP